MFILGFIIIFIFHALTHTVGRICVFRITLCVALIKLLPTGRNLGLGENPTQNKFDVFCLASWHFNTLNLAKFTQF
jgi:hypothetical protein